MRTKLDHKFVLKLPLLRSRLVCSYFSKHNTMEQRFDVTAWLKSLGLEKYASSFVENGIDQPAVISALTAEELKNDLGITLLGDRKKILLAAEQLKGGGGGGVG